MHRHMLAAALAVAVGLPVVAGQTENLSGSTVTLGPTDAPGAVAAITFVNINVNGAQDNRDFTLTDGALTVDLRFEWQANARGDDAVWIAPPAGYRAEPDLLVVREGETGEALIYPLIAPGM